MKKGYSNYLPAGTLRTRREFLRTGILGAATTATMPLFLQNTITSLANAADGSATQAATGVDGKIMVVLQLAGGNDGLNTVVPYADDAYYNARPRLAVRKADVLELDDSVGLNARLPFFKELYDAGSLAVVQGVGYPNPNRSHFRSTEIWETATDSDKFSKTGWLGRYFDNSCAGQAEPDPTFGVSISNKHPQAFSAARNPGVSLSAPELYRWIQGRNPDALAEDLFRDLNQPGADAATAAASGGSSVAEVTGKGGVEGESVLDFLERTALEAQVSSEKIAEIASRYRSRVSYPPSRLSQGLSLVARMIAGEMSTRVYYVSHGGFDTHNGQAGTHANLIEQLDGALEAFFADLDQQGNRDRVVVMTFSEFGRRVKENASGGTDHGTAAPLFVMGSAVEGGLYGARPDLTDLTRGDLKFNVDFRSVYATMLEGWLEAPAGEILKGDFETLGFLG